MTQEELVNFRKKDKENKERRIAEAQEELKELRETVLGPDVILTPETKTTLNNIITQAFELGLIVGLNEAML